MRRCPDIQQDMMHLVVNSVLLHCDESVTHSRGSAHKLLGHKLTLL